MGLVSENFEESTLADAAGRRRRGAHPLLTTGSTVLANAQPCNVATRCGPLAIAHNGNIINAAEIKRELVEKGAIFTTSSRHRGAGAPDRPLRGRYGRGADPGRAGAGGRRVQPGDHRRADALRRGGQPRASGRWCWAGWRAGWWWRRRPAPSTWWAPHRLRASARRVHPDRGRPGHRAAAPVAPPGEPVRVRAGVLRPARQHRLRRIGRSRPPRAGPAAGPRAAGARAARWCSACRTAPTPWPSGSPRSPASSWSTA